MCAKLDSPACVLLLVWALACSPSPRIDSDGLGGAEGVAGATGAASGEPSKTEQDDCGGCPRGAECCAGECVHLDDDPAHCGACARACSTAGGEASCEGGECSVSCEAGFVDCDGDADNGCEAPDPGAPGAVTPARPHLGAFTGSLVTAPVTGSLRPTFSWRSAPEEDCGSVTYELQVDDSCPYVGFSDCAFDSPEVNELTVDPHFTPAEDLPVDARPPVGRRYFWRVRACDATNRCSRFSDVRYVDVGRDRQDLNGDGYPDIVTNDEISASRYTLYAGGPDLGVGTTFEEMTLEPSRIFDEVATTRTFAEQHPPAVRFVGDVNGDGFNDFVATGTAQDVERRGREDGTAILCPSRLLYLGAADVADMQPVLFSMGTFAPYGLASTFAAGDVDADGYADLWAAQSVGDPEGAALDTDAESAVFFVRGGPEVETSWATEGAEGDLPVSEHLSPAFGLQARPDENGEFLGTAVEAGDFDGDGQWDVAVVAPRALLVYVVLGAGDDQVIDRAIPFGGIGASEATCQGAHLSVADFNLDGFDDFVVGCTEQRLIAGFFGAQTLPSAMAFEKLVNPDAEGSVHEAFAVDLDGDRRPEILTGGGQVYGATVPPVWLLAEVEPLGGPRQADELPFVGAAGYFGAADHNGDGYVDLFVAGAITTWIPGGTRFDELEWPYDADSQVRARYLNASWGRLQTRVVGR
jgi:hypothetical protein